MATENEDETMKPEWTRPITKCRTCGAEDQKLSPGGHCWDVQACTLRRQANRRPER